MKRLAIKPAAADREPIDVEIEPGTTAGEILKQIGLAGYWLAFPNSPRFFSNDEAVFPHVLDGDKLLASSPADVGRR
jgi:hypothetical protein